MNNCTEIKWNLSEATSSCYKPHSTSFCGNLFCRQRKFHDIIRYFL